MEDLRIGVVGGTFFIEVGLILSLYMGDHNVTTPDISTSTSYSPLISVC